MTDTQDHSARGAVHIHNAIDASSDSKRQVSLRIENGFIADIKAADEGTKSGDTNSNNNSSDEVTIDASGLHISPVSYTHLTLPTKA